MTTRKRSALYRESIAWQKSMQLIAAVNQLTSVFPPDERFGLTNQLRRASVSIASNIAEGKGRTSLGELIQFAGIARGSVLEVQTQLEASIMLGFGQVAAIESALDLAEEVLRMLNASIVTLKAKKAPKHPNES